jgi:hypothetical protein
MSKRIFYLVLPLLIAFAQPASAFWDDAVSALKGTPAAAGKGKTPGKEKTKQEPSAWDKLVADANDKLGSDKKQKSDWDKLSEKADADLKESEKDQGNSDNYSWDALKERADKAMEQFAKDGQGFDIMRKVKRKVEKLASDEDSALTGRFYDLKQPLDEKKAKPLHRGQVTNFFKNFMDSDWDPEMLEQYYSPKVELAAPYFYLPRCRASYAPMAFRCNEGEQERKVEPHAWVVIYRGQVTAPKSGHFRFVGMGDDTIVVRFDKKVVLESGWSINSTGDMDKGTKRDYQQYISSPKGGGALYQYEETPHWNRCLGGIQAGTKFHVKEGETYPIEILISEIPGVEFGFCLLIEELETGKAPTGIYKVGDAPTLALFRTNETLPDMKEIEESLKKDGVNYAVGKELEVPPFLEDSPIWKVEATGQRRTIIERAAASMSDEDTAMGRRKDIEKTEETKPAEEGEVETDNKRPHHRKRHHHRK